jgi:hypothetical protein
MQYLGNMTSRTDKMSAGNSRAAYIRHYRKRKRLEDNCNNVLKRTKSNAERQHGYRETHKNIFWIHAFSTLVLGTKVPQSLSVLWSPYWMLIPSPHICQPLAPCHLNQVQYHPVSIVIPEICLFTYSTWAEARRLKKICLEILEKEVSCAPPKIRTMYFYILYTTSISCCIYFRLSLGRELPSEQKRHNYFNFCKLLLG